MSGHFLWTRVSAQVISLCNPVGGMTTEIKPTFQDDLSIPLDHDESGARQKGKLEAWHLVNNLKLHAEPMAKEYGFRFCCEEGFRDAKWYFGFAESRVN